MRKAFTLIELLVVVAIIGILAAVLLGTFSGGTESARTARCMSNLRNLASACQSAGVALNHYPPAGSFEVVDITINNGKAERRYYEVPGWIGWNSAGAYASGKVMSHVASASWNTSMYETDEIVRDYVITNGVLIKYLNGSHDAYICPTHANKKSNPNWSYVMNAYFKWDNSKGTRAYPKAAPGYQYYGYLKNAEKRLLFAEIPFAGIGTEAPTDTGELTDSVLQYKGCSGCGTPECIGFNHKTGKLTCANVVFADGHCEKLTYPKAGMGESELQELTQWLCEGKEVSFDGTTYREMEN